jgi:phage terminase large subunit-like protein
MIDETHVFAKKSDAAAIFLELSGALRKRKDGFLFQTTTQSKEPPSGCSRSSSSGPAGARRRARAAHAAGAVRRCEVAVGAIDGGGLDDLAGLTVAGREKGTKRWLYWSHGWVQEDVLFLRKEIAPKLLDFAEAGELTLCREVNDDIVGMVEILKTVRASGLMPADSAIGVDPYGIGALVDALAEAGFTIGDGRHGQVVAVRQGTNLMSAMHSMERKLKDGCWRIRAAGRWPGASGTRRPSREATPS